MVSRLLATSSAVLLGAGLLVGAGPVSASDESPARGSQALEAATDHDEARGDLPAIIRVWTTIGGSRPVAGARVRLVGPDGRTLAGAVSAANGQAVLMPDSTPPRGSWLVAVGGQAEGVTPGALRMVGRVRSVDSQVADINAFTTFEVACDRTGRSRVGCDRLLTRALGLPRGPDHSRGAALANLHFSPDRVISAAAERGESIWRIVRSAVERGASGIAEYRATPPRPRSVVNRAGVASALMSAVLGTVASKIVAPYVDKLLLAMGLKKPEPDLATAEQVAELQQQIDAVEAQLVTLQTQQQATLSLLSNIAGSIDEIEYSTLRASFLKQNGDLTTLALDLHYLSAYADCAQSSANPEQCGTPLSEDGPSSGVGPTDCASTETVVNEWQRAALTQCAYLLNALSAYTGTYAQSVAESTLVGSAGSQTGLVQWAQVAYASHVGDGMVTTANQGAIRSVGEYWLNQWSIDISAWLIASDQPGVLPNTQQPAVVLSEASNDARAASTAAADTTGRYFGRQINAACSTLVYNQRTGSKLDLVADVWSGYPTTTPCDSGNWSAYSRERIAEGSLPNFASLAAHWRPTTSNAALTSCDRVSADVTGYLTRLFISVCDGVSFQAASPTFARACINPTGVPAQPFPIWSYSSNSFPFTQLPTPSGGKMVSTCADLADMTVGPAFNGGWFYCPSANDFPLRCPTLAFSGPVVELARNPSPRAQPGYGGGTVLSLLPFGAPAGQRATTYTRYRLMESVLAPGEAYLPVT